MDIANIAAGAVVGSVIKLVTNNMIPSLKNMFHTVNQGIKTVTENGVEEVDLSLKPIKVSLVAPTRAGKTTLLSTVMKDVTDALPAFFKVAPEDPVDAKRIDKLNEDLEAAINRGSIEIMPDTIVGSTVITEYRYKIIYKKDPEGGCTFPFQVTQPFTLMDIPGGWLDIKNRPPAEWERFQNHLHDSMTLWIPIEAPLLMEAEKGDQKETASRRLKVGAVTDIAAEWAKFRQAKADEPAELCLAPIKCETYFSQAKKAGKPKTTDIFYSHFHQTYRPLIDKVTAVCPKCKVYYTPVESIGCITLSKVDWTEGFKVSYRISSNSHTGAYRQIAGAESLAAGIYQYGGDCIIKAFGDKYEVMKVALQNKNFLTALGDLFGRGKLKNEQLQAMKELWEMLMPVAEQLRSLAERQQKNPYFKELWSGVS